MESAQAGGSPPGGLGTWDREGRFAAIDANMLAPIERIKTTVD